MSRTARTARTTGAVLLLAASLLGGCGHGQTDADTQPRLTPVAARVTPTRSAPVPTLPRRLAPAPTATATRPPAPTPRPTPARTPAPVPTTSTSGVGTVPAAARAVPSRGGVRLAPLARGPLTGKVVVVDPGHNGRFVASVDNRPVPAGAGRTKACNTSGTSDSSGHTEHEFTWSVASSLAQQLRARGATVVLTRPDDRGVGPCVDERARIGNAARADLVVSIHADGNMSARARGYHVIVSTAMAGRSRAQEGSRVAAGQAIRALRTRTRLPRSTYVGGGTALSPRSDIAGLNLSLAPALMLEAGNMRHPADAALLRDPAQRRAIATALADAAVASLR